MTTKNKKQQAGKKTSGKINWFGVASLLVIALFVFVYVVSNKPMLGGKAEVETNKAKPGKSKSEFNIEGKLKILDADKKPVAQFAIEIADNPYSREKGLMYKYYIPDTVGMLFVFPKSDYRYFWMKNTPSSLDIIYADENNRIISIHENTEPYSEASIPSGDKAKYVIELKAGSVARFGIKKGQTFSYQTFGKGT